MAAAKMGQEPPSAANWLLQIQINSGDLRHLSQVDGMHILIDLSLISRELMRIEKEKVLKLIEGTILIDNRVARGRAEMRGAAWS